MFYMNHMYEVQTFSSKIPHLIPQKSSKEEKNFPIRRNPFFYLLILSQLS